jgi:hypothetical protein
MIFGLLEKMSFSGPDPLTYKSNKEKLLKEARVFGLAFLGDGATMKRMPLMNVLAMMATVSPMTIAIQDCSSHMEEGGKKDAVYVASLFEEKVGEFDPNNQLPDVFLGHQMFRRLVRC